MELVDPKGGYMTDCYLVREDVSAIDWRYNTNIIQKPSNKQYKQWEKFLIWLRGRRVHTEFDFDDQVEWYAKTNHLKLVVTVNESGVLHRWRK